MKKSYFLPLCLLALGFVRDLPRARACGGANIFSPTVVEPPRLFPSDDPDQAREEDRFLYPYHVAYPREAEVLWKASYEGVPDALMLDTRGFKKASAAHDVDELRREAPKLIAGFYALPPVLAVRDRALLIEAVKFVERGATPSPADQFLDLMREFSARVPDGWASGAQNTVPPSFWAGQLGRTQAWLRQNPQHPLRDLVVFWQVRLQYFSGNLSAAWSTLFGLYPRRRTRALAEMRYLVQMGKPPSDAQLEALKDPLLVALFVDRLTVTPERFERWWQLSGLSPKQPVSIALQERLLSAVADSAASDPLPASFPAQAARPSQYWGKVRALALLRRARFSEAAEQLAQLPPDPEQATLLAQCYLGEGHPAQAARTPLLDSREVAYLIEVLVPRSELAQLRADQDPSVSGEAVIASAVELLGQADFHGAAQLLKASDPGQAAALEDVASLQRAGKKLELARTLQELAQSLGAKPDIGVYRGISERYTHLPPTSLEAKSIVHFLESTTGGFHALRAYVEWLEAHPDAANARGVLTEADHVYIALGAYGGWPHLFWERHLAHHDLAVRLRQVGKRLRRAKP